MPVTGLTLKTYARRRTKKQSDPDTVDCRFLLAAQHLERSLAGNPGDAQACLKLAACLLELGRSDDALGRLRTVTRSEPHLYGAALKVVSSSSHGRFWLRPSSAAKCLA